MSLTPLRSFTRATLGLTALAILAGVSSQPARAHDEVAPAPPPVVITKLLLSNNTEQFVFTVGDLVTTLTADKILPLVKGTLLSPSDRRTLRVVGNTPTYSLMGNFRLVLPDGSAYSGKNGAVSFAEGSAAGWLTLYPQGEMRWRRPLYNPDGKKIMAETDVKSDWLECSLRPLYEGLHRDPPSDLTGKRKVIPVRPLLFDFLTPEGRTPAPASRLGVIEVLTNPSGSRPMGGTEHPNLKP